MVAGLGVSLAAVIVLVAVLFILARPQRMHGFTSCSMGHNVRASALVLWSLVRGLLAPSEYPTAIAFIDQLPMTTTGKIQRRVLRLQEEEAARQRANGGQRAETAAVGNG